MAAPSTYSILDEIQQLLTEGTAQARGVGAAIDIVPRLASEAGTAAAEEFLGAEAGVEAVGAASAAADGLFLLVVAAVVLAIVAVCYLLLFALLSLARAVTPIPWVGHKIAGFIVLLTAPLVTASTALSAALSNALAGVMHGFISAVHWAVSQIPAGVKDPIKAVVDLETEGMRRQLQDLQAVVYGILGTAPGQPSQGGTVPSGVVAELDALRARIGQIETRNDRQGAEISQLNQRMSHIEGATAEQARQIEQLRVTIYGARSSVTGVQDLVHEIDQLRAHVMTEQAAQTAQLQHHSQQLLDLAPLLTLMYLGERGLTNLRTLEDNPCQCPALPNIGPLMPDALALYEFATNG